MPPDSLTLPCHSCRLHPIHQTTPPYPSTVQHLGRGDRRLHVAMSERCLNPVNVIVSSQDAWVNKLEHRCGPSEGYRAAASAVTQPTGNSERHPWTKVDNPPKLCQRRQDRRCEAVGPWRTGVGPRAVLTWRRGCSKVRKALRSPACAGGPPFEPTSDSAGRGHSDEPL